MITPSKTTHYTWDERNLLVSLSDGENHITYQYDGAGMRVSKVVNGVKTTFINDPNRPVFQIIETRDGSGTLEKLITYGHKRLSTIQGSTPSYPLDDRLGSVRHELDAGANETDFFQYDVFGKEINY